MGRTGNGLHQLVTAFGLARAANLSNVNIGMAVHPKGNHSNPMEYHFPDSVWDMTQEQIPVVGVDAASPALIYKACSDAEQNVFYADSDIAARARTKGTRGETYDCMFSFYQRCDTTVQDKRQIYLQQIRPLLQPRVFTMCTPESDEDTLVIHIRDGDVNNHSLVAGPRAGVQVSATLHHLQPPCAYFHRIIDGGRRGGLPYLHVRLVHSGAYPRSPCIDIIERLHPGKIIKDDPATDQSLARDTCLLTTARNIATTVSSFGTTAMMMNTVAQRIFVVDTIASPSRLKKEIKATACKLITTPSPLLFSFTCGKGFFFFGLSSSSSSSCF